MRRSSISARTGAALKVGQGEGDGNLSPALELVVALLLCHVCCLNWGLSKVSEGPKGGCQGWIYRLSGVDLQVVRLSSLILGTC